MTVVSVIIPVYNNGHVITRAIESVFKQTFQQFELIIVDDGSSDDLHAVLSRIEDPRIRVVLHKRNKGAGAARNTGITEAKGTYVAFLDSDDRWLPEKLERHLRFLREEATDTTASCTNFVIFTPYCREGEIRHNKRNLQHSDFLRGCGVSPGSTLIAEKSVFEQAGKFDESLRRLEDWDWLLRYTRYSRLAVFQEALTEVDFLSGRAAYYDDITESVGIMKEKYLACAEFSRSEKRKLLTALEYEIAVAAYRARRYRLAAFRLLKSFWYGPHRSATSMRRMAKAVWHDFFSRT